MALNAIPPVPPSSRSPFPLQPHERLLHTSPTRIQLTLYPSTLSPSRNTLDPIPHPTGRLHLTNLRILLLSDTYTTTPTTSPSLKNPNSFSFPLQYLRRQGPQVRHTVRSPWFGANEWRAEVTIAPNGGIDEICFPAPEGLGIAVERGIRTERVRVVEVHAKFMDGGAWEWYSAVQKMMESFVVGEEGRDGEGLPAYGSNDGGAVPVGLRGATEDSGLEAERVVDGMHGPGGSPRRRQEEEAPPGYEEVVRR